MEVCLSELERAFRVWLPVLDQINQEVRSQKCTEGVGTCARVTVDVPATRPAAAANYVARLAASQAFQISVWPPLISAEDVVLSAIR